MFGVPGPLGAKLGNFEFGGWGAHVCYSLPRNRPDSSVLSCPSFLLGSDIHGAGFGAGPGAQKLTARPNFLQTIVAQASAADPLLTEPFGLTPLPRR